MEDVDIPQPWLPANAGGGLLAQQGPGKCQVRSLAVGSMSRNGLFEGAFSKWEKKGDLPAVPGTADAVGDVHTDYF